MMPANKLFLLLITCAFLTLACPTSKRKSPTAPPIGGGDQSGDNSKKFEELQDKITATLGKVATLQAQVEQGGVSQSDLDELQQVINGLKDQVSKGGASAQILKDIEDLKKREQVLEKQLEKQSKDLKEQLASDSGDENHATEDKPNLTDQTEGGDAPVLHVSLVWVEEEKNENVTLIHKNGKEETQERSLARGTYVTFHSDKDVTISTIKYGKVKVSGGKPTVIIPWNDIIFTFKVELPMYVDFGTDHCVSATLDLVELLRKPDTKVQMNDQGRNNHNECAP